MTVAAILRHKGSAVLSVRPGERARAVAALLAERRIGAVLVLDDAARILGIVSERDIVRALATHGAAALGLAASDLMTRVVHTLEPGSTETEAMAMMTENRVRHLPVLNRGELVGMISIGDVVKARIMETQGEVEALKAYVAGA